MTLVRAQKQLLQPIPEPPEWLNHYPPVPGWTWVNQGTASIDLASRGHDWDQPADANNNLRGRIRPYTGTIVATGHLTAIEETVDANSGVGLGFRSASGQIRLLYRKPGAFGLESWSSPTAFSAGANVSSQDLVTDFFMQLEDDGTDIFFRISPTGRDGTWRTVNTTLRDAFLTGGPTSVGWWVRDQNSTSLWTLRAWIEE